MAIQLTCEFCGESFRLRDETAGKTIKCTSCGTSIRVPGEAAAEDDYFDNLADGRGADLEEAGRRTLGPAIALYIVGGLWCVWVLASCALTVIGFTFGGRARRVNSPLGPAYEMYSQLAGMFLLLVVTIIVLNGAYHLHTRKSYGRALTGCILACIPLCSPCFVFGIPFGIWGIIVLLNEDVKRSFG